MSSKLDAQYYEEWIFENIDVFKKGCNGYSKCLRHYILENMERKTC